MSRFILKLLSLALVGFFASSAHALEIQWAAGCTSFQSPAVISVSYNDVSGRITLYRSWPSSRIQHVDIYQAEHLSPLFTPTPFCRPTIKKNWLSSSEQKYFWLSKVNKSTTHALTIHLIPIRVLSSLNIPRIAEASSRPFTQPNFLHFKGIVIFC